MTTYVINKKFQTRVDRTARVLEVAEAFGIGLEDKEFVVYDNLQLEVKQGDVVYITGQSGAGKTVVLKELERQMREEGLTVANLADVEFEDKPLIEQIGKDTNDAIRLLSLAGIGDAYLWVRKPGELSDGQRYRFRLAKAIEQDAKVWVADEFLAVLDRVSARVIAFSVQKTARRAGATLLVATTHSDMVQDLDPDVTIEKRFREKIQIEVKSGTDAD
ncbi:ATP-binding cassette domain-containing protein [Methylobacillus sp.]|uniref:ATP-binding cassette domain-containing protein n=1 Tax=Methylobacillus sp. TaxID=56818 RepID=UPI0012C2E2A0|nr:ATP-binding cassette domain-containing protein [Methylobacillus sp.]MPS48536.1 ATP-binding cassette domain-containing protein [Methylobacillus sp.]